MTRAINPYSHIKKPHVIAHRGGGGVRPENTLVAFQNAVAQNVDALELDIHMSSDGTLVVAHYDELEIVTAETSGYISKTPLKELQAMNFGHWFQDQDGEFPYREKRCPILTVEEMFETFGTCVLNIDIKQHEPLVVEKFVQMIERFGLEQKVVVGSFDTGTMRYFRKLLPNVATAATQQEAVTFFAAQKIGLTRLWRHNCTVFQIPETQFGLKIVTKSFVEALQRQGVLVHVWTVNEGVEMQRLLDLGVDGLITDYPARLLKILE